MTIALPHLPASLDGLRIAHLSDLHIRRPRRRFLRLASILADLKTHIAVFTGDYMSLPGDERPSLDLMHWLCRHLHPDLGAFGIFGNHDSPKIRQLFRQLPIHWLENASLSIPGLPLDITGFECDPSARPDTIATLASMHSGNGSSSTHSSAQDQQPNRPIHILLSHSPSLITTAADMRFDIMLSGHTHGGQFRLPGRRVVFNSCDLPLCLSSGILRHRDTLCLLTRGLGENWVPLRLLCPPHLPVYTLRRGPMPGRSTLQVENALPW